MREQGIVSMSSSVDRAGNVAQSDTGAGACRKSPARPADGVNLHGSLGCIATPAVLRRAERAPKIVPPSRDPLGNRAGCVQTGMRMVLWALQRRSFPTVEEIESYFEVSRATAYRYRSDLADALGVWAGPP